MTALTRGCRAPLSLASRIALAVGEARVMAGMSQVELARRSGIGPKTISSYETGERAPGMKVWQLIALADALGTTPTSLIDTAASYRENA